ncbi:UNVERIFIED_ORG: putative nucleotidyltransferase [Methylobacterium sp. SuP10 SLI 274]|uniref:nucleotidyltransferase domain-containing protein n=1 Tax=Methylorubrum extorquens TaxID=408 RepID=UPI00209D11FE|nr:nucleotidyltransferase domain-containing protein [Methylorubrum extorquens]MDF9862716.1 putative nucleotidyltransferase [Methylorubrum pseudosasae]MDH6636327.1 putative nucleotidyltransferase [Methylobacterium sp. SuP10 SLI 274]MDH6665503.1 putative nucleotidyltransferase [Methylorubrum zatmanii]MCP1557425.1 putative nucleotidyltransferase [Methylorubrum extorquens]MDF9791010.1 putative nucleotidyltransferase [Methylorubrum extorquens]
MSDPEPSTDACRSPFPDDATECGVRAFLRWIGGHYPIREVFLFGNRARGTHQADSDADHAVVLDGDYAERSRIPGEMAEIAFDILMEKLVCSFRPCRCGRANGATPSAFPTPL